MCCGSGQNACADVCGRECACACPTAGILSQSWALRAKWGWEAAWVLRRKRGPEEVVRCAEPQQPHTRFGEDPESRLAVSGGQGSDSGPR